jgi:hypothetical protein
MSDCANFRENSSTDPVPEPIQGRSCAGGECTGFLADCRHTVNSGGNGRVRLYDT